MELPTEKIHDTIENNPEDLLFVKEAIKQRLPKGVPSTPVSLPREWDEERKDRVVKIIVDRREL